MACLMCEQPLMNNQPYAVINTEEGFAYLEYALKPNCAATWGWYLKCYDLCNSTSVEVLCCPWCGENLGDPRETQGISHE